MSTKILDVSLLTINIPVLEDEASLKRQFDGRVSGNNEALEAVCVALKNQKAKPLTVKMVLVETESGLGSSSGEVISSARTAVGLSQDDIIPPSLAQLGSLASFFRGEQDIPRVVPVSKKAGMASVSWKRSSWPQPGRPAPVLRYHGEPIHGTVWVMLPAYL
jgi:hypothetical protein